MTGHPTRRDFLGMLTAGATACALPGAAAPVGAGSASARKPNVLFILVDDMGFSDLGCYGNTFCDTPNIDRLAREGMRFTNGYACAPICSASRAAFLTGRSPARLGFEFVTKPPEEDYAKGWAERYADKKLVPPLYTIDLPLDEWTVAEAMQSAGYVTGITGKWHVSAHHKHYLGWSPTHGPFKQGFDWGREDFGAHPYAYDKSEKGTFGPYEKGEYAPDALTKNAIAFLNQNRDEPFFLMVSHYYVHVPLGTKCKWLLDKYTARAAGKYGRKRAMYGAFVETLDHYVGQLLDELDKLELTRDTLVVFTSDNGGHPEFAFNAPLRGSKWNLYEGGIRVPLIARWPGVVEAASSCDVPVLGTDFVPTFCDVAREKPSGAAPLDGKSILSALEGTPSKALDDRSLYWHFPYYHPEKDYDKRKTAIGVEDGYVSQTQPQSAIRKGRDKLIYFYEDERCELYDLAVDVAEQKDLAEKMPQKAQEMKKDLLDYLRDVNARLPRKNGQL